MEQHTVAQHTAAAGQIRLLLATSVLDRSLNMPRFIDYLIFSLKNRMNVIWKQYHEHLQSFSKDQESPQLLPVLVLLSLGKGMKWECFHRVNSCEPTIPLHMFHICFTYVSSNLSFWISLALQENMEHWILHPHHPRWWGDARVLWVFLMWNGRLRFIYTTLYILFKFTPSLTASALRAMTILQVYQAKVLRDGSSLSIQRWSRNCILWLTLLYVLRRSQTAGYGLGNVHTCGPGALLIA